MVIGQLWIADFIVTRGAKTADLSGRQDSLSDLTRKLSGLSNEV